MEINKNVLIFSVFFVFILFSLVSAITITDVKTSPSEVAPGETAKITLDIENTLKDNVENLNIGLDFSSITLPISPYGGSSEDSLDELNDGDEETFTFNIIVDPNAAAGVYKIPVKIRYNLEGESTIREKTGTISVLVNSQPKIKTSVEGSLIKGRKNSITIRVINEGLTDLKLVGVQFFQPSNAVINSPLFEYLGTIETDDFDSIDLLIFVPQNAPDTVAITSTISYKDATNNDLSKREVLNLKTYTESEAKKMGLIDGENNTVLIIIIILIVLFILYRINKSRKKRKLAKST